MSLDDVAPDSDLPEDAWDLLSPLLTPERRTRFLSVASARSNHVRLVVQDIHDPHNVSACLRSADAFGVQTVDVVTLRERFRASTVARGVAHWLTVERHQSVEGCIGVLRKQGYRIYAGVPAANARPLRELPVDQKIAVVFGNEHDGIDPAWRAHIDQPFTIPMVGMVESLNISVCAAITLEHLTAAARSTLPAGAYELSPAEQKRLLGIWACRQFRDWRETLKRLREKGAHEQ